MIWWLRTLRGLELRSWCTLFTIRYSVHSADASGRRPVSSPLPRTVPADISKLSALTQHHCPSVCPHRRIPTSDSNVSFFPYRMFSLFLSIMDERLLGLVRKQIMHHQCEETTLVKRLNDVRETIVYHYKIDMIQVDITRTCRRFSSETSSKLFRVGQTCENVFIVFLSLNPENPNPVGYWWIGL